MYIDRVCDCVHGQCDCACTGCVIVCKDRVCDCAGTGCVTVHGQCDRVRGQGM